MCEELLSCLSDALHYAQLFNPLHEKVLSGHVSSPFPTPSSYYFFT